MMGGGVGCVDEKHIIYDDRKKFTHYILRWEGECEGESEEAN